MTLQADRPIADTANGHHDGSVVVIDPMTGASTTAIPMVPASQVPPEVLARTQAVMVATPMAADQLTLGAGVPASLASANATARADGAGAAQARPTEVRRRLRVTQARDVLPVVGAGMAAISLASLIMFGLFPMRPGALFLGFWAMSFIIFLAVYGLLVSFDGDSQLVKDRIAAAIIHGLALTLFIALFLVISFTLKSGWPALKHTNFYTQDLSATTPLDGLDKGGVVHAIVGTFQMMMISLSMTIPLGFICAVFLSETKGPFTRLTRTIVEAMTALPSIVAGLFVYAIMLMIQDLTGSAILGKPSSGAAAVAIGVMMLPIIIRSADVVLRLVPGNLKEAAAALGAPRWRIVWHVVLPTARAGLMTAIILGTARGVGETSPVLLTAGSTDEINFNPFYGQNTSLPLLTYLSTIPGSKVYTDRAFGAATVLLVIVITLFIIARTIGGRGAGILTPKQQRKRSQQSAEDLQRIEACHMAAELAGGNNPSSTPHHFQVEERSR